MAELTLGVWSGTIPHSKIPKEGDGDGVYYSWDMKKSAFPDFIKYANSNKQLEKCTDIIQKYGFLKESIGADEITTIAGQVEWISAITFFDGMADKFIDNLKLDIRIKYVPTLDENKLRRDRTILERAIEMFFMDLRGFSNEISPCIFPAVPKVVSLSVLCNDDFMSLILHKFENAPTEGGFDITDEIINALSLLDYDGKGYPSVIYESENLYHIVWEGGLSQNGRIFYFVNFTNKEKFIVERLKHSLPQNSPVVRGTTDLFSDILSYVSFWFSSAEFYKSRWLYIPKRHYEQQRDYFLRNLRTLKMKQYNGTFLSLLGIQGNLRKFQVGKESFFEGFAELESPIVNIYSPEIPVVPPNVFDTLYLKKYHEDYASLTFSQSSDILKDKINRDIDSELNKLSEYIDKTIALINSRIQIKETRLNSYLIAFTSILVLIGLMSLFGFRL